MHRQRPSITLSWDQLPTLCTLLAVNMIVDGDANGLRLRNRQSSRSGDQGDKEDSEDGETHCWLKLGGGELVGVTGSVVPIFPPGAAFISSLPGSYRASPQALRSWGTRHRMTHQHFNAFCDPSILSKTAPMTCAEYSRIARLRY
jgi:hypothetical protein